MSSWTSVATVFLFACMIAGSVYVRGQLAADANLPMQWGFDGKPTWYAPRDSALAFIPVIALFVLLAMAFAGHISRGKLSGVTVFAAGVFLVVHLVWLYFAARHAGRA